MIAQLIERIAAEALFVAREVSASALTQDALLQRHRDGFGAIAHL